jgi:TIR domain
LDTPFAEKLFDYLEANGCDPWLDTQKLAAGVRWDETIREEMHDCDVIVVLLSNGAITKEGYIRREFRLALRIAEEKLSDIPFLVPICLDSCKVPTALAEYQWLDARYRGRGFIP